MALRVLGTVAFDGEQLSPRERTVLAALAIAGRHGTSVSTLADAVWGDSLPSTWPKQLQASIGILRRSIGVDAIETTATGYALAMDAEALDVAGFERLVEAARRHTAADDPERAAEAYRRALTLWRGTPFAELAEWEPAAAEISRLEEVRQTSEEELLAARLACGEHRAAIAEAERLVRESPYREERWCLLALANYQSGRQAEALATLRTARRRLDDDLGIDPGERLTDLETAILRQDPALAPARHEPRISDACPYRGLNAYGADDADVFFGRDAEIETVLEAATRRRFLALTGASGSGKSSLALAGVVPLLRSRGWSVKVIRPGDEEISNVGPVHDRHALVVDQFEELFQLGLSAIEIEAFGEQLESYVREGGCLLLTVRSDFLDRCAAVPALARLIAEGVYVVGPLSKDDLRIAIEGPAARAGLRLESGLTELVLRDARGASAALPLLSHALVETWLRREGSVLTVAGYEASGGISGAIAQSADDLYATLSPDEQAICRSTMLRLVSRGPDGSAVRRRVASGPLVQDRDRRDVLARLTRARLITAQDDSIVVAHEAIASAWPRLGAWLDEDAEGARLSQHLTAAADQWAEAGMPESDLYRGARLAAAEEWLGSARPGLTADESSFIEASVQAEQAEQRAAEARAALDRRHNRRLRLALASVAVLLVASLGATAVAVAGGAAAARSADAAKAAETDATIEAIMGTSLTLRDSQRDVAALLAAELWQRWPDDPRARAALMGIVTSSGGLVATSYVDAERIAGQIVPGTNNVMLVSDGSALELRDLHTGEVAVTTPSPVDGYAVSDQLAMSADGSRIAVVLYPRSDDGPIKLALLDASDLKPIGRAIDLAGFPQGMAVDADGSTVAAVYEEGAIVEVVDTATLTTRISEPFIGPEDDPEVTNSASIAIAPDGRIALGTIHPELLFLDPVDLSITARSEVPAYSANQDSALTSDGVLVASGERATTAVDTFSGRMLWSHVLEVPKPLACARVAASAAAGTLYCGDDWGGIVEYDLATGLMTGSKFDPQLGQTGAIDLTTDGTELLAIGAGTPTLSLWRTDGGGAVSSFGAHGRVMLDGYGVSGESIVVAERPADARYDLDLGHASVWAPTDDRTVAEPREEMDGMGWAGPNLLSGFSVDADALVTLDATTGARVESGPIPESVFRFWMSPHGDRVYSANYESAPDDPGHGFISVYSGDSARLMDVTFDLGEDYPWWVSASEDDRRVAITRWIDGVATTGIFDGRTGSIIVDGLEGPTVTAITPTGELLAARDGRITRHDLTTLERTGTIPGAGGEINSLQVSRDGQTLLTTSNDDTVTLYDLPSGRRLGDPIPASAPLIGQGALRPDGLQFVVNVADGIQVWDADPAHHFEAACRIAGRGLSAEERATYLAALPASSPACAGAVD